MTTEKIQEDANRLLNRIDVLFDSNVPVPPKEVMKLMKLREYLLTYLESLKT